MDSDFERTGMLMVRKMQLAWIDIVDREDDQFETIIDPTSEDLERVCLQYRLDFDKTLAMIENRSEDIHGIVIDVARYRKHLEESS